MGGARRHGLTLLEAVVALTILAVAAGACLELRAQGLRQARSLQARQELAREAQAVFRLATSGHLGPGQRLEERGGDGGEMGAVVWTGEWGERSWRLVKEVVMVEGPYRDVMEGDAAVYPERVAVRRYTLEIGGETYELEWTR